MYAEAQLSRAQYDGRGEAVRRQLAGEPQRAEMAVLRCRLQRRGVFALVWCMARAENQRDQCENSNGRQRTCTCYRKGSYCLPQHDVSYDWNRLYYLRVRQGVKDQGKVVAH